jgi:hypothetical protein
VLADRISRLDDVCCAIEASNILTGYTDVEVECCEHMSRESYLCLQDLWTRGLPHSS